MELTDYCSNVETELTGWKAKFFDISRKLDSLGTAEKEKVMHHVEDIHILLTELDDRIHRLRNECPIEWDPDRAEIDNTHVDLRGKFEETMAYIGKAAPVSVPG